MPTFKHSGAIGDVIYALPAIRALGGGDLFLPTGKPSHFWNGFYGDPIPILKRLLESQPYVRAVHPWEGQRVDYDLDDFRKFFATDHLLEGVSLCDTHLMAFGIPVSERDRPWIDVLPAPLPVGKDVVICRSSRYRSPFFRWSRVHQEYAHRAVFCGLPVEHAEYEAQVGPIERLPTEDLFDLASRIAACSLFVGNQSSPYAIAEGLKKDALLEVCPDCPNCVFVRPGAAWRTVY